MVPALTADEWKAGQTKPPLMSKFTGKGIEHPQGGDRHSSGPAVSSDPQEPKTLDEVSVVVGNILPHTGAITHLYNLIASLRTYCVQPYGRKVSIRILTGEATSPEGYY